jgi:hypothetical protein
MWPCRAARLQAGAVCWNDGSCKHSGDPVIERRQRYALPTLHRVADTSHTTAAADPMQAARVVALSQTAHSFAPKLSSDISRGGPDGSD